MLSSPTDPTDPPSLLDAAPTPERLRMHIEALCAPVLVEGPTGPDLEYDEEMYGLTQAMVESVEGLSAAWRATSERLLLRTKDLRVGVAWTQCAAMSWGPMGLAAGLGLCTRLITDFGEALHPRLDPDDDDPHIRAGTLRQLVAAGWLSAFAQRPAAGDASPALHLLLHAVPGSLADDDGTPTDQDAAALLACLRAAPDHADALAAWSEAHAEALRLQARGMAPDFGLQAGDLEPLLQATRAMVRWSQAVRFDDLGLLAMPHGRAMASRTEAVFQLDRARDFLERTDRDHPALLLLQRSAWLLAR